MDGFKSEVNGIHWQPRFHKLTLRIIVRRSRSLGASRKNQFERELKHNKNSKSAAEELPAVTIVTIR